MFCSAAGVSSAQTFIDIIRNCETKKNKDRNDLLVRYEEKWNLLITKILDKGALDTQM